jgi:predicted metal-dependent hydrolase
MAEQTRKRGTRATFLAGWEFGSLPEAEVLRRGADLFDRHLFWEAHEVWEEVWRRRAGQPDRDFLKGIIQGAAGLWHVTQGNYKGAVSVLGRAVDYLAPYRPEREGIDVAALSDALARARDASAEAMATGTVPRLPEIQLGLGPPSAGAGEGAAGSEEAR